MNNVNIIGRLTSNPLAFEAGIVSIFTIAVNYGKGEKRTTQYVPCKAYGKTAINIIKYFEKGNSIGINGSLNTYKTKKGDYTMIVKVDNFFFLPNTKEQYGEKENYTDWKARKEKEIKESEEKQKEGPTQFPNETMIEKKPFDSIESEEKQKKEVEKTKKIREERDQEKEVPEKFENLK